MNELGVITGVVLHKLQDTPDRRGHIATFTLKDRRSQDNLVFHYGLQAVSRLIELLDGTYRPLDTAGILIGLTETNECWVTTNLWDDTNPPDIVIDHKYWGDGRIAAFRTIIKALAPLYRWELRDDTDQKG